MLLKRPIISKSLTSLVLFSLGDVLGQVSTMGSANEISVGKLDGQRVGRAAAFGFFLLGPLSHLHYMFVEWLVVKKLKVTGKIAMPLVKVLFEQFVYWAPGILTVYHVSMGWMEGLNQQQIFDRLKAVMWPTLVANWVLWPAASAINFRFIPIHHQLNYTLFVSLFWSTYLSRLTAAQKASETKAKTRKLD